MATAVRFDTTCRGLSNTPASRYPVHRLERCPKAARNAAKPPLGRAIRPQGDSRTMQFSAVP